MTAKLLVKSAVGDESFECDLNKPEIKLGRSQQINDVVLVDVQVSREHAIIRQQGDEFILVDLQSANGSFVNGRRISGEERITEKDAIQIGKYLLKLQDDVPPLPILPELPPGVPKGGTILLRAPTSASILMPKVDLAKMVQETNTPDVLRKELEQLRKKADILSHLYELNGLFNSVFALEEIFERMADVLFRLTPAERCLVQIKDPNTKELKTRLVKFRSQRHNPNDHIAPPRAIVDQVLHDRVTLLSLDAQTDFSGKSVVLQNVQSVICAPLMVSSEPMGVLYIDNYINSHKNSLPFSSEDLDLLNAIAVQTSMALDNATAHDRLMKEALAREAYSRFLPDHIVNEILASPDSLKLGGTNKDATILFADVRGFTPLSEKLRPEQIVELLNEYFTNMTDIIFSHQGLLDKYMGDGLMALFGVAYAAEDAPANAVEAAIDMQRRMVTLREQFNELYGSQISIGIGINSGTITVGYIGSNRRMEYTGIGDAVNLAARLESNTKPSQILVSNTTHQLLKGKFPTRPLGKIQVKGKSEPQEVFEVVWQEEQ
ncbi:MAG: adenylate/guanylate cyclase domain-containing protein [Acidobacteriota bacterium]